MYSLVIIIIIIIIIITIIIILTKNNKNNFIIKDNSRLFYEGKSLSFSAKKRITTTSATNKAPLDCNSNIIECSNDKDCQSACLSMPNHLRKCITGLCHYRNKHSLCSNSGQITSTFLYGRLVTACICPEKFIGLFCQTRNEMRSSYARTFELSY